MSDSTEAPMRSQSAVGTMSRIFLDLISPAVTFEITTGGEADDGSVYHLQVDDNPERVRLAKPGQASILIERVRPAISGSHQYYVGLDSIIAVGKEWDYLGNENTTSPIKKIDIVSAAA